MDMNEVYLLLSVAEKAHAQGSGYLHIRNYALARLTEINAEADPNPHVLAEPVAEEPVEETEDGA